MMEIFVASTIFYLMFCVGLSKLMGMKGLGLWLAPLTIPFVLSTVVVVSVFACLSDKIVGEFRNEGEDE